MNLNYEILNRFFCAPFFLLLLLSICGCGGSSENGDRNIPLVSISGKVVLPNASTSNIKEECASSSLHVLEVALKNSKGAIVKSCLLSSNCEFSITNVPYDLNYCLIVSSNGKIFLQKNLGEVSTNKVGILVDSWATSIAILSSRLNGMSFKEVEDEIVGKKIDLDPIVLIINNWILGNIESSKEDVFNVVFDFIDHSLLEDLFAAILNKAPLEPLQVVSVSPFNGAINIATDSFITIKFSRAINKKSINDESIILLNQGNEKVPIEFKLDQTQTLMTVIPLEALSSSTFYKFQVSPFLKALDGGGLVESYFSSFRTAGIWWTLTNRAICRLRQEIKHSVNSHAVAATLSAIALIEGWNKPEVADLLQKLYSLQNPDGGYGLDYAWDAFGDGTVNSVDTSYTVTVAYHVGIPLIEGFKAGVVPKEKVERLIDLLLLLPIDTDSGPGISFPYSFNENDRDLGNVHNVNSSVGNFFSKALDVGIINEKLPEYISKIEKRETYSYLPSAKGWYYYDGPIASQRLNDPNHAAAQAMFMIPLNYSLALEAGGAVMAKIDSEDAYALIGYLSLVPYFPDYSMQMADLFEKFLNKEDIPIRWLAEATRNAAIISINGL